MWTSGHGENFEKGGPGGFLWWHGSLVVEEKEGREGFGGMARRMEEGVLAAGTGPEPAEAGARAARARSRGGRH
jgi:hypothetical protein